MLRLIPGWKQFCEQSPRRRVNKVRPPRDRRNRHAAFEELECRRLLAADFTGVATNLQSALEVMQSQVTVALDAAQTGSQSHIPIVGDTLGQAAQFVSKFNDGLTQAIQDLNDITNPTDTQIKQAILTPHSSPTVAEMVRSGLRT
jgi:hypothetical protein